MVVKLYLSGISGNKEVKKKQQRVQMILDSKSVTYEAIDITEPGREKEKEFMQQKGKVRESLGKHPLPPQIFNEDDYCGDYEDFDLANETDELEAFLHIPIPSKFLSDNTNDAKVNGSRENNEDSKNATAENATKENGIEVELTSLSAETNGTTEEPEGDETATDEDVTAVPETPNDEIVTPAKDENEPPANDENVTPATDEHVTPATDENVTPAESQDEPEAGDNSEGDAEEEIEAIVETQEALGEAKEASTREIAFTDSVAEETEDSGGKNTDPTKVSEISINSNLTKLTNDRLNFDAISEIRGDTSSSESHVDKDSILKVTEGFIQDEIVTLSAEHSYSLNEAVKCESHEAEPSLKTDTCEGYRGTSLKEPSIHKELAEIDFLNDEKLLESHTAVKPVSYQELPNLNTDSSGSFQGAATELSTQDEVCISNISAEDKVLESHEHALVPAGEINNSSNSDKLLSGSPQGVISERLEGNYPSADQQGTDKIVEDIANRDFKKISTPAYGSDSAAQSGSPSVISKAKTEVESSELHEEHLPTPGKSEKPSDLCEKVETADPKVRNNTLKIVKSDEPIFNTLVGVESVVSLSDGSEDATDLIPEKVVEAEDVPVTLVTNPSVKTDISESSGIVHTGVDFVASKNKPLDLSDNMDDNRRKIEYHFKVTHPSTTPFSPPFKTPSAADDESSTLKETSSFVEKVSEPAESEVLKPRAVLEANLGNLPEESVVNTARATVVNFSDAKESKVVSEHEMKLVIKSKSSDVCDIPREPSPEIKQPSDCSKKNFDENDTKVYARSEPSHKSTRDGLVTIEEDSSLDTHDGISNLNLLNETPPSKFDVDNISYTPQLQHVLDDAVDEEEKGVFVKSWNRRASEADLVKHVRTLLTERDARVESRKGRDARSPDPHAEFLSHINCLISDIELEDEEVSWPVVTPPKEPTPPPPEPPKPIHPQSAFILEVLRVLNSPVPRKREEKSKGAEKTPQQESKFLSEVKSLLNTEEEPFEGRSVYFMKEKSPSRHEDSVFVQKVRVLLDEKENEINVGGQVSSTNEVVEHNHDEFLNDVLVLLNDQPMDEAAMEYAGELHSIDEDDEEEDSTDKEASYAEAELRKEFKTECEQSDSPKEVTHKEKDGIVEIQEAHSQSEMKDTANVKKPEPEVEIDLGALSFISSGKNKMLSMPLQITTVSKDNSLVVKYSDGHSMKIDKETNIASIVAVDTKQLEKIIGKVVVTPTTK